MAVLHVVGHIPVVVVVDTEEGTVTSVHAMDESFEPHHVTTFRGRRIGGRPAAKALRIADDPLLMWPAWEWGW